MYGAIFCEPYKIYLAASFAAAEAAPGVGFGVELQAGCIVFMEGAVDEVAKVGGGGRSVLLLLLWREGILFRGFAWC